MYRILGCIVAGASSALVTGDNCFASPYHFGVFIVFLFVGSVLGSIADSL